MQTANQLKRDEWVSVSRTDKVSKLIGKMREKNATEALVLEQDEFLGMVLSPVLKQSRPDISSMEVDSLMKKVPKLNPDTEIDEIARLMYNSNATALPVIEDDKVMGIVHVFDVFKAVKNISKSKNRKVKDLRHPKPHTVRYDDRLGKAIELMEQHSIDRIPVVDESKDLVGFLSYMDMLENYYRHLIDRKGGQKPTGKTKGFDPEKEDLMALPVKDFMNNNEPLTINDNDTLKVAATKMSEEEVLSLIVVEGGSPTRILTRKDILEEVMKPEFEELQNIKYKGINELDVSEATLEKAKNIISQYSEKIGYLVKNEYEVIVHFKEYEKGGTKQKFSVNVRVNFPGGTIGSDRGHGWDLTNALHDAFTAIENQLRNKWRDDKKGRPTPRKDPENQPF